ncbi:MAG: hypothetical protein HOP08_08340 [Cyclobacteriaceae bacterium]|nr:hypothetical protein [Cyclobacteriaceae bacterium]
MKHIFLFFCLTLFGFLSFPASGISNEDSALILTVPSNSDGDLFAEKLVVKEEANLATFIRQPLSDPSNRKGNGSTIVRTPDDLIQSSVLEFHDRYDATLEIVDSKEEFKWRYSSIPPPRQYSLLRILFRAIIAPNAP